MKKSTIALLLVVLLLIPATLFLGSKLPGRSYYITSTLVIIEILIPFILAFGGRKPQARELVVIAVMCAIAVAARAAIPLPHFKPMFAIIMISGFAFGAEAGFLVGAVGAFASNFFYGQGAYTPWQMLAYGVAGLLGGLFISKGWLKRKKLAMAIFGFFCVMLVVGPLLDTCSVFLMLAEPTIESALPLYASGLPVNLSQAVCTFLTILLLGEPFLEKLDRVKLKFALEEK